MSDEIQLFSRPTKKTKGNKTPLVNKPNPPSNPPLENDDTNPITLKDASRWVVHADSAAIRPETFASLGVSEWLVQVVKSLGMSDPTVVQRHCIPKILAGDNVIGCAETGSGKTAAFALPILQRLALDPFGVFALVLTPTRELAVQISEQFRAFGAGMSLSVETVIGGLDQRLQAQQIARRPHILVATPGRLAELIRIDEAVRKSLKLVKFLVLDEADRLLEPTFASDLEWLLQTLPAGDARQTLLFSATMTPSLQDLHTNILPNAYYFTAYSESLYQTAKNLTEHYLLVPMRVKDVYLQHLLSMREAKKIRSSIIFTGTCKSCRILDALLKELGIPAVSLHSGKSQRDRLASLDRFRSSLVPLLVATDVAARGLDIPTVDFVVNYDLPQMAQDYVHRVGRTARAGRGGWAVSFVTQYDVDLVQRIEGVIGHELQTLELEEKEVLSGMTTIFKAKRAAAMQMVEDDVQREKKRPRG